MATRQITVFEDDLDGSHADETVTFSIDGTTFEIDLNTEHAEELRGAFQMYVEAGRKLRNSARSTSRQATNTRETTTAQVRAWAQRQGLSVNARGRIQADIIASYHAAQEAVA